MSFRAFAIFLAFVALTPALALAETAIGVLDVQALMSESVAAKSVEKQVNERKDKFLEKLSKQEQELRDTEKKLSEQRASMSKEDFAKKAKEFEENLLSTRKAAQQTKRTYDEATGKALKKLRDKIYEIAQAIATEKKLGLIISKQSVVIGAKEMDITEEAMKRLNGAVTNIPLEIKE